MEPRKFVVWNVWGMHKGNVRLLATFHFKEKANADKLASTVHGGYVLRSHVESEPRQWVSHAEGDHKSEPKPVPVPVAVPDVLPPAPTQYRNTGWTG